MYGKHVRRLTVGNKVGYLTVRIAGDVLQRGVACGTLVEALDGDDREQLVNGPCVRERLEEREVAEILVGKQLVQSAKLLGSMLQRLRHAVYLAADAPVHALYLGTGTEVYDAV